MCVGGGEGSMDGRGERGGGGSGEGVEGREKEGGGKSKRAGREEGRRREVGRVRGQGGRRCDIGERERAHFHYLICRLQYEILCRLGTSLCVVCLT